MLGLKGGWVFAISVFRGHDMYAFVGHVYWLRVIWGYSRANSALYRLILSLFAY